MKVLGIIFIVLSILIFRLINPTKGVMEKPLWASTNSIANLIVSIIWLGLLIMGIIFLFQ